MADIMDLPEHDTIVSLLARLAAALETQATPDGDTWRGVCNLLKRKIDRIDGRVAALERMAGIVDAPPPADTRMWCAECGDQLEADSVCRTCFELRPCVVCDAAALERTAPPAEMPAPTQAFDTLRDEFGHHFADWTQPAADPRTHAPTMVLCSKCHREMTTYGADPRDPPHTYLYVCGDCGQRVQVRLRAQRAPETGA